MVGTKNEATLDPIFPKGTLLPAAKTVKYRATAPLAPGKPGPGLAIKLWEGEFFDDADANEWVGNVLLSNDSVKRTLPEGSEIEIRIEIDASRKMTVAAFAPLLNQHFSGELYVPQRDEQDFANLADDVIDDENEYRARLSNLEDKISEETDASVAAELEDLRKSVEELERATQSREQNSLDPDHSRRIVEDAKEVRGRLGRLERQFPERFESRIAQLMSGIEPAREVVEKFGSPLEKQEFTLLHRELERAAGAANDGQVKRAAKEIDALRWRVLLNQDWYWKEMLDYLRQPNIPFVNAEESKRLIAQGSAAVSAGDGKKLRDVVKKLWDLQPKGAAETARDRAMASGLRKY